MSHYSVAVVVTPGGDLEAKVAAALAPFDENFQTPPYVERCHCVGSDARKDAWVAAEKKIGSLQSIRHAFNAEHGAAMKERAELEFSKAPWTAEQRKRFRELDLFLQTAWKQSTGALFAEEAAQVEAHPRKDAALPDCENCKGTGLSETTYNPLSKWDWWALGGRFSGRLRSHERLPEDLRSNTIQVGEHLQRVEADPDLTPFALLTPDGAWHEKGRMGWWGVVSNENADWRERYLALLRTLDPGLLLVGVDCHI